MQTALREVREPSPAVAIATALMLTGLLGAIVAGHMLPAGDAAGFAVRGGWQPVAWAPDGSALLARSGRLATIDRRGHTARLPDSVTDAQWLAGDGPRLAVSETVGDEERVVLRDLRTRVEQELLREDGISGFRVTADGAAWVAATEGGLVGGGALADIPGGGERATDVALSDDGSVVVFRHPASESPDSGVLAVSEGATGRIRVLDAVALDEGAPIAMSPSGRAVAVLGYLDGRGGLVIVPLDPLGPPTLVVPDAGPAAPVWAPNGEAVLVSRLSPAAPTLEIVVARLANAGGATVSALGPGGVAGWLDDATVLLVDPSGRLVRARVDASTTDTVGVGASASCRPAVAPDGTAAYCGRDGALRLLAPR
jgi:hypothetical protein